MQGAREALESLPWVDKKSVKVEFADQKAHFRVPDMKLFNQEKLFMALKDKGISKASVEKVKGQ